MSSRHIFAFWAGLSCCLSATSLFGIPAEWKATGTAAPSSPEKAESAAPVNGGVSAKKTSCESMMPILTVNEKTGGAFHRLPFSFRRTDEDTPLRIFIAEDTPSGSGPSIRSSVWLAAITAAMQRNDVMNGVRITVEFSGDVDGPSAGSVMCLAILSAMDGRTLPEDFAMTGTIMPDGTIGAVGGIALKVRAAIKRGCRRIYIPMCQRFERQKDGTLVDLFRLGEKDHVTVRPVRSIGEAYSNLYGLPPPSFPTIDEFSVCRLPREVEDVLIRLTKEAEDKAKAVKDEQNEDVVKILTESPIYSTLFNNKHERKYISGRLLSAYEDVNGEEQLWKIVPKWCERIKNIMSEFPVLAEDPPFSKEDRRKFISAVKTLRERFEKSFESLVEQLETKSRKVEDRGYVPEEGVSEIAAQEERSEEVVTDLVGMSLSILTQQPDLDKVNEMTDEEVKLLYVFEECKELMRTFFQSVLDDDEMLYTEIYRHYSKVRPNADLERAERLFHSAWLASDAALTADVIHSQAEEAESSAKQVWLEFAAKDVRVAAYLLGKDYTRLAHSWLEHPERLGNHRYHAAAMLSVNARKFASSCALLVKYGPDMEGELDESGSYKCKSPDFLNYLIRRARLNALLMINECVRAGVPCLSALAKFENAETMDVDNVDADALLHDVLENYWAAGLEAKALLMGFGPKRPAASSSAK